MATFWYYAEAVVDYEKAVIKQMRLLDSSSSNRSLLDMQMRLGSQLLGSAKRFTSGIGHTNDE